MLLLYAPNNIYESTFPNILYAIINFVDKLSSSRYLRLYLSILRRNCILSLIIYDYCVLLFLKTERLRFYYFIRKKILSIQIFLDRNEKIGFQIKLVH